MSTVQQMRIDCREQPVNLVELAQRGKPADLQRSGKSSSFKEMFSREIAASHQLSVSRHAHQRMFSRGIELSEAQLGRIAEAIDKAAQKGSRETLVLADDMALVVSVENRTIITAFDRDQLHQGVVTSIDSAVIL